MELDLETIQVCQTTKLKLRLFIKEPENGFDLFVWRVKGMTNNIV